jgi:hypothetical protein
MDTLNAVYNKLQQYEAQLRTQEVVAGDITMLETGKLRVNSEEYSMPPSAEDGLARLIRCPVTFFQAMPVDLRSIVVNRLILDDRPTSRKLQVTLRGKQVLGFSDSKLLSLSGTEVLRTALSAMPDGMKEEELEVRDFQLNENKLNFEVTSKGAQFEASPGDLVAGGLSLHHSVSGQFATQITTFLYRLVCRNGLLVPVCRNDKRLRVRRLDGARFSKGDMLENLARISELAWQELSLKLEALAALGRKEVDPRAILENVIGRMRLNKKVADQLRAALLDDEKGYQENQLAVIHALSRIGTHSPELNEDLRRRLMTASGILSQREVHRCTKCMSIIFKDRLN